MLAAPLFPADDPARAAPPARVHVGKPEDLFPTPFVGQRVALRSPSRGREVRLFTVAKVFAADGDVKGVYQLTHPPTHRILYILLENCPAHP